MGVTVAAGDVDCVGDCHVGVGVGVRALDRDGVCERVPVIVRVGVCVSVRVCDGVCVSDARVLVTDADLDTERESDGDVVPVRVPDCDLCAVCVGLSV